MSREAGRSDSVAESVSANDEGGAHTDHQATARAVFGVAGAGFALIVDVVLKRGFIVLTTVEDADDGHLLLIDGERNDCSPFVVRDA